MNWIDLHITSKPVLTFVKMKWGSLWFTVALFEDSFRDEDKRNSWTSNLKEYISTNYIGRAERRETSNWVSGSPGRIVEALRIYVQGITKSCFTSNRKMNKIKLNYVYLKGTTKLSNEMLSLAFNNRTKKHLIIFTSMTDFC